MSDQEEQAEEPAAPPASTDSEAVQAAMQGIPGLEESVGNRPPRRTEADATDEEGPEDEEAASFGTQKKPAEDSETVQQALKQFGLQ